MGFQKGYTPHNKGLKGYTNAGSFKFGQPSLKPMLGKKMSEETKQKMRDSGKKRHQLNPLSQEARNKISLANMGRKPSPRTKEGKRIMSQKMKGNKHTLGWKPSTEWLANRSGEQSWCWKGGISEDTKRYKRIRRNRELGAEGCHTTGEWETLKAQYNWTCLDCKKQEPAITLTEDHIIPLSKGGSDNIENIQPLCRSCNSTKHTKIINFRVSQEESEVKFIA